MAAVLVAHVQVQHAGAGGGAQLRFARDFRRGERQPG